MEIARAKINRDSGLTSTLNVSLTKGQQIYVRVEGDEVIVLDQPEQPYVHHFVVREDVRLFRFAMMQSGYASRDASGYWARSLCLLSETPVPKNPLIRPTAQAAAFSAS